MLPALQTLIEAAVLAPSGDNLQPWKFEIDDARRAIVASVDPTRDTSPMNAGQRMSRIALGAAVENMAQTAEHNGWRLTSETDPTEGSMELVWVGSDPSATGVIPERIRARATNRTVYDGSMCSDGDAVSLLALKLPVGVMAYWVSQREPLDALATVIGQADECMFSRPDVRQAFLENVRFDQPADARVNEGLSLGSLGVSKMQQKAMGWLKVMPDWLVKLAGVPRSMNGHARRLLQSSAGVCLVCHAESDAAADLAVGRAMERIWLALTEHGYAVQPMMSLPVLENLQHQRVREFYSALPAGLFDNDRPRVAAILRFGRAIQPSVTVGRRPIKASIQSLEKRDVAPV